MNTLIGIDLVSIKEFTQSAKKGKNEFLRRIFSEGELSAFPTNESRAGIFAAKEAVIKAFGFPAGKWLSIIMEKNALGKPKVYIHEDVTIVSDDISITHAQDNAIAVYTAITTE